MSIQTYQPEFSDCGDQIRCISFINLMKDQITNSETIYGANSIVVITAK